MGRVGRVRINGEVGTRGGCFSSRSSDSASLFSTLSRAAASVRGKQWNEEEEKEEDQSKLFTKWGKKGLHPHSPDRDLDEALQNGR